MLIGGGEDHVTVDGHRPSHGTPLRRPVSIDRRSLHAHQSASPRPSHVSPRMSCRKLQEFDLWCTSGKTPFIIKGSNWCTFGKTGRMTRLRPGVELVYIWEDWQSDSVFVQGSNWCTFGKTWRVTRLRPGVELVYIWEDWQNDSSQANISN